MDTERLGLTEEEKMKRFISQYLRHQFVTEEAPEDECDKEAEFITKYVLSLLEPVELEALGDEELKNAHFDGIYDYPNELINEVTYPPEDLEADKRVSQATISKNQSKGQLYRVREASYRS